MLIIHFLEVEELCWTRYRSNFKKLPLGKFLLVKSVSVAKKSSRNVNFGEFFACKINFHDVKLKKSIPTLLKNHNFYGSF